jgi:hypothetical protein
MALGNWKLVGSLETFVKHRATRHISLALLLLVLIGIVSTSAASWSDRRARELSTYMRHGEVLTTAPEEATRSASSLAPPHFSIDVNEAQKARLETQWREVRNRARFHLQTWVFLFANYYMSIIVFSVAGAIAAVSLVLISQKGWTDANEYIITVFFVMTAASVFFGAFPGLFRHEETIADNKRLYLKYVTLEDEILTYAATGLHPPVSDEPQATPESQASAEARSARGAKAGAPLTPGSSVGGSGAISSRAGGELTPGEFILHIDRELARDDIPIGIDYTKAPTYKGVFELQPGQ